MIDEPEPYGPEPREVVLSVAMTRSLTVLETARALALAGVRQRDAERLLATFARSDADPAQLLAAAELLYSLAFQYVLRTEPGTSWEDAQRWRVVLDIEAPVDELAEAEAIASVDAAIVTGLPPAVAGSLSLAQMDEYRRVAEERNKPRRRRRAG
jgi:hypothetical protein